jgi:hypothetical protein
MALTMINLTTCWFKIVELPLVHQLKTIAVNGKYLSIVEDIFDESSGCIAQLVNMSDTYDVFT